MLLRLLTTTDLHGHLVAYDYIKGRSTQGGSLAGVARLIKEARAEAEADDTPVLLLDNGDTFQGTPLATHLAEQEVTPDHPIVASLNHLRYDALGVGNHDLDHGMPYLRAVAEALDMPLVCSNLVSPRVAPLASYALLSVEMPQGAPAPLTVGVMSVLPENTQLWQGHHLDPGASLEKPAETVARVASDLKQSGADIVVVLAHMGVGHKDGANNDTRAAQGILESAHIDALILGHTHRRLPSADYASRAGVDLDKCTVGGVPAVMAGHAGSDLGVLDLGLEHTAPDGWKVTSHHSALRPNGPAIKPDPAIRGFAQTAHAQVVNHLDAHVATSAQSMHSYFSLVSPAPTQNLVAQSKRALVADALAGTSLGHLPVLATAPAHGAGGRDGLSNYTCIPNGPVLRRHIAGLNPFANQTVGIRTTGTEMRNWLEHSALIFSQLTAKNKRQTLTNPDVPAFQFDTIFGLTYLIDPTAPAGHRIRNFRHEGTPVEPDQEFILATSYFRARGGGGYSAAATDKIVIGFEQPLNDSMINLLTSNAPVLKEYTPPWRFAPHLGVEATFLSHPQAVACLEDIAHLHPTPLGETSDGFIQIGITL
ncbi:5'-nucleotidase C-terminal domain-containing protein [Sulfitobacter sp. HNIBRBA2951]|uniref:5'-nucleotidase C-terminal domain-containing protein n=1 Tax=Sulfitobacter aquimarinus TaxID=3158557 RepID=UPI0032DEEFAD